MTLLRLFTQPGTLFRELADEQRTALMLGLYVAAAFVGSLFTTAFTANSGWDKMKAFTPWISTPYHLGAVAVGCSLLGKALWTLFAHAAARMAGGESTFRRFWTVMLFTGVVMSLCYTASVKSPLLGGTLLWVWDAVLSVAALSTVYNLSIGRSVLAFIAAWAAQIVLSVVVAAMILLPFGKAWWAARSKSGAGRTPQVDATVGLPADYAWAVESLDGAPHEMSGAKGKTVVLNFWATWCGPCVAEMPSLQALHERFKGDDRVAVYAVSTEDPSTVKDFVEEKGWTLPVFVARQGHPSLYNSPGIPVTFILSPGGQVVKKHVGMERWDAEEHVRFIESVRDGTLPPLAVPAAPPAPGQFHMSSAGGGFAVQGSFDGSYQVGPAALLVHISTAQISVSSTTAHPYERRVTAVRVGLGKRLPDGQWNMDHKSEAYRPDKTMKPGDVLPLDPLTARIEIDSAELPGRWIIVEIAASRSDGTSPGTSYVQGPAVEVSMRTALLAPAGGSQSEAP